MNSWIATNIWLVPSVPLAASLVILTFPKSARAPAAGLAIIGQIAALAMSIFAFLPTLQTPGSGIVQNFTWFTFGETALRLGWVLDPLAAVMLMMITLVGLCIFIFSIGYMAEDKNFKRFFAYLSFFSAAMLGVVIANSLLLLFICWELVGLASYLLIGFWIERPSAAAAAKKAFITTRIGDLGLFLGMLWLYNRSGTLLFYDGGHGCLEGGLVMLGASATFVALLIFCGAVGKSGQFPLHVWLPDAMEGPTPVSALIHAATMVAAGVFLVARVYPIFLVGAVNGVTPSLTVVVWIGVITGLMAALIAIAQPDIKRILAYSTVSQLGLMMVSLGVGGVAAGIMHLLAHGFFKALLFLGAGSVIHGSHHEQDIRKMGGLRRAMPATFLTYAIGMMALSGVPLVFSGAWTKEEILHTASHWPGARAPYFLLLAGVVLTALYMTRQIIYVFFGNKRAAAENAHESPRVMTIPLIVLAICTIAFSAVLTPAWPWLHSYLTGESAHFDFARLIQPMLFLSLVLVTAGIGLGIVIYRRITPQESVETDPLEHAQPGLFRFLENKMWIDEFYDRTVIAVAGASARISDWMDRYFWDGLVRGFAALGQLFGIFTDNVDERGINAGVDQTTGGARGLGRLMSVAHSGQIQTYLGIVAIGMVALLLLLRMVGLITTLILIPMVGALALYVGRGRNPRAVALLFNALAAFYVLMLWQKFDTHSAGLQIIERHAWIPAIGAEYLVGVDGLSLLLVLLTTLVTPFAFFAQRLDRGACALMLVMQAALYGTFTAQNFVLWFLFYEMSLVPAFLLIKLWGGENRDRAATKFFLYTFLGSIAMLLGFLGIYFARGTFDFAALADLGKNGLLTGRLAWLVFAGIFLGLAVKVPLFPFHTWLPDAYESAPIGVSMVLTGLLSKMGVYGFVRLLLPLFPNEIKILGPWLLALAVCSIVFSSLAAWAQSDLKRMVAYLSINHLGYCMLGLFAITAGSTSSLIDKHAALSGVFMQIFNHGITAAALFYFVGLLEQRRGLRGINDFGGLMQRTPLLCGWMSVAMFSSLGLPGLNGFIGEFLIFKGSFAVAASFTAVAVLGLLFTAIAFMRAMQALFSGPLSKSCNAFPDLLRSEKFVIIPVTLLMFAIGVVPQFMFNIFNTTVVHMARLFA